MKKKGPDLNTMLWRAHTKRIQLFAQTESHQSNVKRMETILKGGANNSLFIHWKSLYRANAYSGNGGHHYMDMDGAQLRAQKPTAEWNS